MKSRRNAVSNTFLAAGLVAGILLTASAGAAEVTFLPGLDRMGAAETLGLEPSLALLTWELPGGLLVADRLAPVGSNRYGNAIPSAYPSSEWFIVELRQPGTRESDSHHLADTLASIGTVHLTDAGFCLLEVAPARLADFAASPLKKQRILLSPPPDGWDRYSDAVQSALSGMAGAAAQDRTERADTLLRTEITDFLAEGDEPSFRQVLQEITGARSFFYDGSNHTVSTRYYNTADKTLVADYLADKLEGYGYTVTFEPFSYYGTPCRNVVATLTGTTAPDEYVVVGGHYDSTSGNPSVLAPGAEDNGSGTSLVMEIARMAAGHQFDRSVQFVLFDSEEQGLNGSEHFVDEAASAGRVIVSAIIADMVTYYSSNYGVLIEGESPWESLMTIMEDSVADYTTLRSRKDYYSWGSDHVPFQQAGIPAFLAIDWDWGSYPYYHSTGDTWAHVEATAHIGFEIVQACAATLAQVAGLLAAEPTLSADLACLPAAGTLPFASQMTVTLDNQYTGQTRRMAGAINATLAGGSSISNWRSGFTNIAAGDVFVTTFTVNLPALGSLVGGNTFTLVAEDVTPPPYNQPPHPLAGDTDSASCTVTGMAP